MRAFISFVLPFEIRQIAGRVQFEIRQINRTAPIRWVEDRNLHLTLLFLGETEESEVKIVEQVLSETGDKFSGFKTIINGLMVLPNVNNPQTLALAVNPIGENTGQKIFDFICARLSEARVAYDLKPWRPHITLGRIKNGSRRPILGADKIAVPPATWRTDAVHLVKSELTPAGSRYTVLSSFELKYK